jgi:type IV pilus assembly protein PilW
MGAAPTHGARNRQRGMSLIELMVAMTLGMVVVLSGLIMLTEIQVTSATVSDASRLQLKADSVMRNMGFQVAQSGAVELQDSGSGQVVFSDGFSGFNPGAAGIAGANFLHVHGLEGAGANGSDVLRISYEDNGTVRDCLGQRTSWPLGGAASRVDNQYWIAGNSLMCLGASNSAAQPIADGVEDLQVGFTLRSNVGGVASFRTYNATALPASQWRDISAVTVCLRIAGAMQNLPAQTAMTGCRGESVAADGKLRRVFTRTFAIRNAVP